jgi:hypothetical protein
MLPRTLLTLLLLAPGALYAGSKEVPPPVVEAPENYLLNKVYAEGSYTFEGGFDDGGGESFGAADVWYARGGYEHLIPIGGPHWFARVGARYTALGLGDTDAPLPDLFQSVSMPIGIEWRKETGIPLPKFTFSINPGLFFSEDISSNDFDIPTVLAYGFDLSPDLRLYVGAFGGLMNKYAVLPGGGLAWRFHEGGLLALTFPQGGVFLFPSRQWEIFAGAEWFSLTHRTDGDDEELPGRLQDALVDYREIRAGIGIKYKPSKSVSLGINGGYTLDREWDYERADYTLSQENAAYVKAAFELRF